MSTVQDFENAPVGATASAPNGSIAFKTGRPSPEWSVYGSYGGYYDSRNSADMGGFTLNPTAPTTAREAFDLTWNLAHEVKEGQVIPKGMRYVRRYQSGDLATFISNESWTPRHRDTVRTQDPLPDPKPEWTNAPAVVAFVKGRDGDPQVFTRENETGTQWVRDTKVYHWYELVGVVPLYPREGNEGMYVTGPGNIQIKDRNGQTVWEI